MKPLYVVGFLFTQDGSQVVLIQKNRPVWQAGKFNGLGGKLAPSESWEDAMSREFKEEAGVLIPPGDWQHMATLFNEHFECRFFRAFSDLALNAQTMKTENVSIVPVKNITNLPIVTNLHWLIPMALDEGLHFPVAPIKDGP